jgi:hypothetical protein
VLQCVVWEVADAFSRRAIEALLELGFDLEPAS